MEKIVKVTDTGKKCKDSSPVFDIELADGRKGVCFNDAMRDKEGKELDLDIRENDYNGTKQLIFNIKKPGKYGSTQKDWKFEKRKAALEQAVILGKESNKSSTDVIKVAESFFEFLNK